MKFEVLSKSWTFLTQRNLRFFFVVPMMGPVFYRTHPIQFFFDPIFIVIFDEFIDGFCQFFIPIWPIETFDPVFIGRLGKVHLCENVF